MISGTARSDNTVGRTEDIFHFLRLGVEIAIWALNDADGVDPEISNAHVTGHGDGIFEGVWELVEVNIDEMGGVILGRGSEMVAGGRISPLMRQGDVLQVFSLVIGLCLVQLDLGARLANVDEPGGQLKSLATPRSVLLRQPPALGVVLVAFFYPSVDQPDLIWCSRRFGDLRKPNLE